MGCGSFINLSDSLQLFWMYVYLYAKGWLVSGWLHMTSTRSHQKRVPKTLDPCVVLVHAMLHWAIHTLVVGMPAASAGLRCPRFPALRTLWRSIEDLQNRRWAQNRSVTLVVTQLVQRPATHYKRCHTPTTCNTGRSLVGQTTTHFFRTLWESHNFRLRVPRSFATRVDFTSIPPQSLLSCRILSYLGFSPPSGLNPTPAIAFTRHRTMAC